MGEQIQGQQVVAPAPVEGQVAPVAGEPAPVIQAVEQGAEQPFKFLGNEFHNEQHANRIIGEKLDRLEMLEAKTVAFEQSQYQQQQDNLLQNTVKQQNPGMTDEQVVAMVEQQKEIYSQMFAGERQKYNNEIGNVAFNNYIQQSQVPDDTVAVIRAAYQQPEIAKLVNEKDANGVPFLSFNDLRSWAEAPAKDQMIQNLQAELSALKNGSVAAGAQSVGANNGAVASAGMPPLDDYEALKKWKLNNVK